jgi:capsular polysaccharide biosynthesis protein
VTEKDQAVMPALNGHNGPPDGLGPYDLATADAQSADFVPGLVSLGFLKSALRRSAWFWCVTAVAGLLAGLAAYRVTPHPYQASTTVLLAPDPNADVNSEAANTQAMAENQDTAQSYAVAGRALRELGLRQSVASFLSTYSADSLTDRVVVITVSAPSTSQALLRANAVTEAFLQFRADELQTQQNLALESVDQQIGQARQEISSLDRQISRLSAMPASPAVQSRLSALQAERTQESATLTSLEQTAINDQQNVQPAIAAATNGTTVLNDAVPVSHSRLKHLVLYALIGLVMGLILGVAIILVRAIVSDRVRQRGDVAQALGAPVKLSVGRVRLNRWLPRRHRLAAASGRNVQRIVAHLDRAVPNNPRRAAALAVVPVDDSRVAALSLVALAVSRVKQGEQVVLADLAHGAPAARLLGFGGRGVGKVDGHDDRLTVAVPGGNEALPPAGPFLRPRAKRSSFSNAVFGACAQADVVLTLATLDPSLGGDHLATWATNAVAVITAGRSSWTRISAIGEMIRLSGTHLVSAVLIGADDRDESLGVRPAPEDSGDIEAVK